MSGQPSLKKNIAISTIYQVLLIILPKFMGINGVFYASPIADALAFVMSVSMVLLSFRELDRKEKTKQIRKQC